MVVDQMESGIKVARLLDLLNKKHGGNLLAQFKLLSWPKCIKSINYQLQVATVTLFGHIVSYFCNGSIFFSFLTKLKITLVIDH